MSFQNSVEAATHPSFRGPGYRLPELDYHDAQGLKNGSAISQRVIEQRGYASVHRLDDLERYGFSPTQYRRGLLIPLHFASDEILRNDPSAARFMLRPVVPREDAKGKRIKYEIPAGTRTHLDVPPAVRDKLSDVTIPLFVTEGVKKADSAVSHGLCCIALLGVWMFDLEDWKYINLNRRHVFIAFDSDVTVKPEVNQALRRFRQFLRSKNATVKVLYLRSKHHDGKVGLDDYFATGGTVEDLLTFTKPLTNPLEPRGLDETLPTIETQNEQIRNTSQEALDAIVSKNEPPVIFVYGKSLARIREIEVNPNGPKDEDDKTDEQSPAKIASLEPLTFKTLRHHLARVADWVSISSKGKRSVNVPEAVVADLEAFPSWPGIPLVFGVVNSPVFAANGSLCDQPGYSEDSKLYYHADEELDIGDTFPSSQNVKRAKDLIYGDLFFDFPFADGASRAHALAMLLLPFVRSMISGPTPLHLFDAPKAGTGKSLLAALIANVFLPAGVPFRTTPSDDSEWRKTLTSIFREGWSHVIFDNVRDLQSNSLHSALTATDCLWTDRILGSNDNVCCYIRCVWAMTCNNITGTREQLRRCAWIRLDAKVEHPESRDPRKFKHKNIVQWLRENRERIVGAAITLVRAWIEAGQPGYSGDYNLGSFEDWVRVMGGILETVGEHSFLGNQKSLNETADSESPILTAFVEQWWLKHQDRQVKAIKLLDAARPFFEEVFQRSDPHAQAISLSKHLTRFKDNPVGIADMTVVIKIIPNRKEGTSYQLKPIE